MTVFENDVTYDGAGHYAVITCSAVGCNVHVRYNPDAQTRPRYCRKHAGEMYVRGFDDDCDDVRKRVR